MPRPRLAGFFLQWLSQLICPSRTDDHYPVQNIDPLVRIALKSSDHRDNGTWPQPIITPPIHASVLINVSGYFRSLYKDGAALKAVLSSGQAHTIRIPWSLSWAYGVIFQAIYKTGGRNLAQQISIDGMAYSSVALLHAAAERLQMPELESRLLHRLETITPDSSELAYLLSSVSPSDISIHIFINDLARRYHHAWLDGDTQTLQDISRRVEQQDSTSFRQAFAKEIDRRRRSSPCKCRRTYCCGNEACCLHRWTKRMNHQDSSYPRHHPNDTQGGHDFNRNNPKPKRARHVPDFPAPPRSPRSSFTSDGSYASMSSTTSSSYACNNLHGEPQRYDDSTYSDSRSCRINTTTTRTTTSATAIRNRRWFTSTPPASPQGSRSGRFAFNHRTESGAGDQRGREFIPGRVERERQREREREREREQDRDRKNQQKKHKKHKKTGKGVDVDVDVDEIIGAFCCIIF